MGFWRLAPTSRRVPLLLHPRREAAARTVRRGARIGCMQTCVLRGGGEGDELVKSTATQGSFRLLGAHKALGRSRGNEWVFFFFFSPLKWLVAFLLHPTPVLTPSQIPSFTLTYKPPEHEVTLYVLLLLIPT